MEFGIQIWTPLISVDVSRSCIMTFIIIYKYKSFFIIFIAKVVPKILSYAT
jgi:hypothetical protein